MRWSTIEERFNRFVTEPTCERYFGVRELILSATDYDPYSARLDEIATRFEAGEFSAVLSACDALGSSWCLSPRVHFFAGVSALEKGENTRSQREKRCAHACLSGLMSTGEGTAEHPFRVTYISDEYDLLRSLRVSDFRGQELVDTGSCHCDLISCDDGAEYWFDVTDLLATGQFPHAARGRGHLRRPVARSV
jgi:hypothetical protein